MLPSSLVTGDESDVVVGMMSDEVIESWTRLTEGYAVVEGDFQKPSKNLCSSRLISWKNALHLLVILSYCNIIHFVTFLPHPQRGSLANEKIYLMSTMVKRNTPHGSV